MRAFANWLIWRAIKTPYFHLHHADGSIYMERYWLIPSAKDGSASNEGCFVATWRTPFVWLCQRFGIAVRIHCIHTPDLDRAMHDHPWTFASLVLRGFYTEARPVYPETHCFQADGDVELSSARTRSVGSFAVRRFYHRHRITSVSHGGVWTLFVTFRKRQPWGFFTPLGKVWWHKYPSVHNNAPIS